MPAWPGTLPQDVFVQGYSEQPPELALRTQMDIGPAKLRRRQTAAARPLKATVGLTRAQVATLDAFFLTDLAGGALSFTWTHPRTLAAATFRFVSRPSYVPESGASWLAELDLEILP